MERIFRDWRIQKNLLNSAGIAERQVLELSFHYISFSYNIVHLQLFIKFVHFSSFHLISLETTYFSPRSYTKDYFLLNNSMAAFLAESATSI